MKIGFVGLGIMGKPMAKNLLKAGYDLTVCSTNRAAKELVECGAKAASNAEIGEKCELVLTMLPNSPQVKSVMLGDDGVAAVTNVQCHGYGARRVFTADVTLCDDASAASVAEKLETQLSERLGAALYLSTGGTTK